MGEVYRARDTKLDRDVAIKVLPSAVAQDPERLARFEREAKVLAALNHPNIAQIYGVEESNGVRAIVMELVPGQILKGPIPLNEALRVATQVADALSAAHEKGITHRDLKPLNVMITPEGVVKILDFGLATVSQESGASEGDPSQSPTMTLAPTRAGVILGTAAYMSPEQARGQNVDRRSDIWSFGVLLYEMLTGRQPFRGDTISDILASVLKEEPNLEHVPAEVHALLERCLEKEPKRRLQAIGDWDALLNLRAGPVPREPSRRFSSLLWIATGLMTGAVAVLGILLWRETRPGELKRLVQLDVDLGDDVALGSQGGADVILSRDGTRLVYVSQGRLLTRRLNQPKPIELVGTEGAFSPFFSPEGQWVAFFAQGKLKKISVESGTAVALSDYNYNPRGGTWGEDGDIIAALVNGGGLSRIPSGGGLPTPVTKLAQGEATHRWPQLLPGGKALLFTAHTSALAGFDDASIEVMSLVDHHRKTIIRGGTFGRYLSSGHLIYLNRGTLFAAPFDLDTLEVRGTAMPVVEQVAYSTQNGSAQLDFSSIGTLAYQRGRPGSALLTLQWLDSAGKTQTLLAKPGDYEYPRLSPDGQRLALIVTEASNQDIWVYEWQRDTNSRVTFEGNIHSSPLWSADGRNILFQAPGGMFWTRTDGAGKQQLLIQNRTPSGYLYPSSLTPDGKRLAFYEGPPGAGDLSTVRLESDSTGLRAGKPEAFLQTPFDERWPSFSPDGR
jgi:serine/threonine-protein kinase